MSEFTDQEKELCIRTKINLDFIWEAKKEGKQVYEITQLFNSLLGIIVHIHENDICFKKFSSLRMELIKHSWQIPSIKHDIEKKCGKCIFLSDFLEHLRHSIAHVKIIFSGNSNKEIDGILFTNKMENGLIWECFFPIPKLRIFIDCLCEFVYKN